MKRILLVFLVTCALVLLFDLRVLATHGWDPRAFILERDPHTPLEQGWNIGYDAQWYYAIALGMRHHPFSAAPDLDLPAYRYQRILFPLVVFLASLGRDAWVPWAMLLVNGLAAGAFAAGLGALLARREASPWLAVGAVVSAGFLLTLRMNLLEPLALALAVAGWLAYEKGRLPFAVALFALGGLAKEFALVFPAALAGWLLWQRSWRAAGWLIASAAPFLAWGAFLTWQFGTNAQAVAQSTPLLIPFWGLRALTDPASRAVVVLWVALPAAVGGMLAIHHFILWGAGGQRGLDAALLLAQAAFVATLPLPTWVDPLAVLRVGLGLLAAWLLWAASTGWRRGLAFALGLWLPSGLLLFLVPGFV